MFMYSVHFYEAKLNFDTNFFNTLRSSLEITLHVWYPAAGRLTVSPINGKLDLLCNNGGALMVEAKTEVEISQLGELTQYKPFYEKLVHKPGFNGGFSDMPLVVVQVTWFRCGGYSIGVGASHSLFDGKGFFNFLRSWALRASSNEVSEQLMPVHERGYLLIHQGSKLGKNGVFRVPAFDHLHHLIELASACGDSERKTGRCRFSEMDFIAMEDNYAFKTFRLSKEIVESLKRKVSNRGPLSGFSTFEVVAAHLWKVRSKSLGLRGENKVCLQFSMDARAKVVPPLSTEFSGNAYVMASIFTTAKALEEEPISTTAYKIREAKESITDEYIRAYLIALDAPQKSLPPLPELTIVSDLRNLPFHCADFGHGHAASAALLPSPLPQSAFLMRAPNEEGAIDVSLGLPLQIANAFSHCFLHV
ncbi:hypothetical protein AMTR_s00086p00181730 [Amborella trichopoda]|uniref:Uncharacterized protein n=2 Tax=Amborella trichopoda TaxID=13333 RepID=W1P4L9_AMBTC|nr:hypothetical protein AMTR_s00086p00181730 [Amborella trichopoda]